MNWDTVKGDWKQFSGKAKAQWGKLTDDEPRSTGTANSLKASCSRITATPRTRRRRRSITGAAACKACEFTIEIRSRGGEIRRGIL